MRRTDGLTDRLTAVLQRPAREWVFDALAVVLILLVMHGTSLWYGELRGDDWLFLREARLPLRQLVLQTWNGHVFPLWRVETVLLHTLFGAAAIPFRLWLFLNIACLAFLQARVLHAWGLARPARLVGIIVLCGWTQWAQITMGYWTLSITAKVWIATSLAMLAVVGGGERLSVGRKVVIALAALAAILEDPAGAIVVPALVLAALASGWQRGLSVRETIRRAEWPVAMAVICTIVFVLGRWLLRLEAQPILGLGGGSIGRELVYLLSFGTVGTFVAPVTSTMMSPTMLDRLAPPVALVMALEIWSLWRTGTREERAPFAANVALLMAGLVMVVAARPYPNYHFMVTWTHYVAYLYVPFAAMIAVAWQQLCRVGKWRPAVEMRYLVLGSLGFLGAQEASARVAGRLLLPGGRVWEIGAAERRVAMRAVLRDSIFTPLMRIVPEGGAVPQMVGLQLDERFPRLHPFMPLSFYEEGGGVPRGRLRWVVGPYENGIESDTVDATPVSRMKGVVHPAFVTALHEPSWWRDTYFASAVMTPVATNPIACDALQRSDRALSGDADKRHWLLLRIREAAKTPPDAPFVLEVAFRTSFRERAVYRANVEPAAHGCVRVELLNLPELVLSDSVTVLGVEAKGGHRQVDLVGLFPTARAR